MSGRPGGFICEWFVYNTDRGKRVLIHATCLFQSSTQERHFNFFLGGQNFLMPPDYWKIGKKQHFICSNLTLFIVPFFLSFFFSFFSFFFPFSFSLGATAPQPPSNDAPASTRQGILSGGRGESFHKYYICSVIEPHAGLWQLPDLHIARMERVKQLAAFAAALLQLLLLLLPLQLPCPTVYAIPSLLLSPASAVAAPLVPQSFGCASGYILNYNTAVAPDPAHRCLNACSSQQARQCIGLL